MIINHGVGDIIKYIVLNNRLHLVIEYPVVGVKNLVVLDDQGPCATVLNIDGPAIEPAARGMNWALCVIHPSKAGQNVIPDDDRAGFCFEVYRVFAAPAFGVVNAVPFDQGQASIIKKRLIFAPGLIPIPDETVTLIMAEHDISGPAIDKTMSVVPRSIGHDFIDG